MSQKKSLGGPTPFFAHGKTHIFPWAKMGLDPPKVLIRSLVKEMMISGHQEGICLKQVADLKGIRCLGIKRYSQAA